MDLEKEPRLEARFLPDDPTSEDTLGGRDEVAQAIARTFVSEDEGKAIALTGSWGSGKSSVVKMVRNKVEAGAGKGQKRVVVNFDAWCHKGDPLRCAFLVELGDRLADPTVAWLEESWWKGTKDNKKRGKKNEILKRITTTRTRTTPVLTTGGRLLGLALILFPIFIGMIAAFPAHRWIGGLGLIFSGVLFLSIAIIYLVGWVTAEEVDGHKQVRFFFEERETDVSTTEERTPDPTSFEFKTYFEEILKEALSDHDGNLIDDRKLMIVIDNLDRVDHSDAKTIWATMQTFFEPSASEGTRNYVKRLWLLVPFDPEGISRIWSDSGLPEADSTVEGKGAGAEQGDQSSASSISSSFKDKAFQITFHVSPPVQTKWKGLFETQVAVALPDHDNDYHGLYRLYDLRSTSQAGVTPRGIILYINRIVALYLQWGDKIPLVVQGLYALKSEIEVDGQNEEERIRNLIENMPPRFISVIDEIENPEWRNQLAALHYNVPQELGLQMVYKADIRKYLREGNVEGLAEIASVQGVPDICEDCLDKDISTYDTRGCATAARVIKCLDGTESVGVKEMWQKLAKRFKRAAPVIDLDDAVGVGISEIVAHAGENLTQVAADRMSKVEVSWTEENADALFENWLACALQVIEQCRTMAPEGVWHDSFFVPSENHYLNLMVRFVSEAKPDDILRYFRPSPGKEGAILARLQDVVAQGQYSDIHDKVIKKLVSLNLGNWSWEIISQAISTRLSDPEADLPAGEIAACIRSLDFLGYDLGDSTAQTGLATMSNGGQLQHRLTVLKPSDDVEATALCMFPILLNNPNGDVPEPFFRDSQAGVEYYHSLADNPGGDNQNVVNSVMGLVFKHNKVPYLVESVLGTKEEGLATFIVNQASVNPEAQAFLSAGFFLQHFDNFARIVIDENLSKLVETLVVRGDLIKTIGEGGFKDNHIHLYSKILALANVSAEDPDGIEGEEKSAHLEIPAFKDFLVSNLSQVQKETWLEELKTGGQRINLVFQLENQKTRPNLGINFSQAVTESIQETIKAEPPSIEPAIANNADLILDAMDSDSQKTFLGDLCNIATTEKGTVAPILRAFGRHLYSDSVVESTEKNYQPLFLNILSRVDTEEVSWIVEALNNSQKLLDVALGEIKDTLLEKLASKRDEPELPDDYRTRVFEIGDVLGENLRPQPEVTPEEGPETVPEQTDPPDAGTAAE